MKKLINVFLEFLGKSSKVENELNNLAVLKVLDNKEFLKELRSKGSKSFYYSVFWLALGTLISSILNPSNNISTLILGLGMIFCIYLAIYYGLKGIYCISLTSLGRVEGILPFYIFLLGIVNYFLSNSFIKSFPNFQSGNGWFYKYCLSSDKQAVHSSFALTELQTFWGIFVIFVCGFILILFVFIEKSSIFEMDKLKKNLDSISSYILVIVTFVIGIEIDKVSFAGTFLLLLVIETALISFFVKRRKDKQYKEAQKIFEKELLKPIPNYQELKKCYYYGGEKYKEKMLSTEKFLKVILWNEESSFYTWKSYENYLEYKNYRYKQFRKNSKEGYLTNV